MTRTLVTGAAGFIGSNLVDRLLAEGHQVIGIDNLSTGHERNLEQAFALDRAASGRFTFIQLDVQAPELHGVVQGCNPEVIFHLAAQVDIRVSIRQPHFDARTNVLGTINLCEASRGAGVRRIIYAASGGSRYGAPVLLPVDETCTAEPLSPLAVAKLAGELYLYTYAGMYGMAPICLALANVYGPRQHPHGETGPIAVFASAIAAGRSVTVYCDGTATRDYVYVDDVVEAFVRAGRAPLTTMGTYNIGTGKQTSDAEVHGLISALCGDSMPPTYSADRTNEPRAIALDSSRAAVDLDWQPAVDLNEGIGRTMRWLSATPGARPAVVGA
jgi:UDP-glucose 4-epimerase